MWVMAITIARTFTRMNLLEQQIRVALRRANAPKKSLDVAVAGVRKKYIVKLQIYATASTGKAIGLLEIRIDWQRHKFHISTSGDTVAIDSRWENDTAVEIDEALNVFEGFLAHSGVTTLVRYVYYPGADVEAIGRELGTQPSKPMAWAGTVIDGSPFKLSLLDEASVIVRGVS
ncbi:hypothetical protein Srufu_039730 [Streptomyces libani subsp. rufus]|nr:hypothetical protein Srufu_039730 [Streptomyces libani subsp. rufus]